MKNENKLIYEVNRINKLMGNNLLVESAGTTIVRILKNLVENGQEARRIFVSDPIGLAAYRRLESVYNSYKAAGSGVPINISTVIDDFYTVSRSILDVRLQVTDFLLNTDSQLKVVYENYLKDRERLKSLAAMPDGQLRDAMEGVVSAWYRSSPNPVPSSQIDLITDRLMFDIRRDVNLPPSNFGTKIIGNIPVRNLRFLFTQLSGMFASEKRLKRKFMDASKKANDLLVSQNPSNANKEIENMLAILSSAKKGRVDGFNRVYEKWKNEMLSDPQSQMKASDFVEFDNYIKTGRGLELYDNLTKLDPNFKEETWDTWMKLWPFKNPSTPGGLWIFNKQPMTSDWWKRVGMFILTKNARTLDDYIKYLLRRGVRKGTIQILVWRFIMLRLMIPFLYTVAQAIPSTTEKLVNDALSGLQGFGVDKQVDFAETPEEEGPERMVTNILNTMYGIYFKFNLGDLLDQQTFSNEAVKIGFCMWEVFNLSGNAPCLDNIFDETKKSIEQMDIPEKIKEVTTGETEIPSLPDDTATEEEEELALPPGG